VKTLSRKILTPLFISSVFWLSTHLAHGSSGNLSIEAKTAPIVPHGLMVGRPLDVTLSFVDLDPATPGIMMKAGGTAAIMLPKEVINTGYPVAKPGSIEGCKPPIFTRCSSGGMLVGWPQSPLLPFAEIEYVKSTHSIVLTPVADTAPYSLEQPGFKLIHLFTFGFLNPEKPGEYPVSLEIRPDPNTDQVMSGTTMLKISDNMQANIAIDTTQSIHIKGPRYKNTMFQTLSPGHTSRNLSSNLWDANHDPIIGAEINMTSPTAGDLVALNGDVIGSVKIQTPADAKGFYLLSTPSFEAKTGLAGYPTGRLVAALKTAPKAIGTYVVDISLNDGNSSVHTIRVQ